MPPAIPPPQSTGAALELLVHGVGGTTPEAMLRDPRTTRVTGDAGGAGVAQHRLGSGSADTVDQEFQRGPGALRGRDGRGQFGDSLSGPRGPWPDGGGTGK